MGPSFKILQTKDSHYLIIFRGKFEFQISEFYNDNDNFGKV